MRNTKYLSLSSNIIIAHLVALRTVKLVNEYLIRAPILEMIAWNVDLISFVFLYRSGTRIECNMYIASRTERESRRLYTK